MAEWTAAAGFASGPELQHLEGRSRHLPSKIWSFARLPPQRHRDQPPSSILAALAVQEGWTRFVWQVLDGIELRSSSTKPMAPRVIALMASPAVEAMRSSSSLRWRTDPGSSQSPRFPDRQMVAGRGPRDPTGPAKTVRCGRAPPNTSCGASLPSSVGAVVARSEAGAEPVPGPCPAGVAAAHERAPLPPRAQKAGRAFSGTARLPVGSDLLDLTFPAASLSRSYLDLFVIPSSPGYPASPRPGNYSALIADACPQPAPGRRRRRSGRELAGVPRRSDRASVFLLRPTSSPAPTRTRAAGRCTVSRLMALAPGV